MTNQDLIINGVDHAKFDLEWVKKGGVAVFKRDNFSCFWTIFQGNIYTIAGSHPYYGTTPVPPEERFLASFKNADITKMQERMATPAECKTVGIEYIKRPVSDQSLSDLQQREQAALRYAEKLRGIFHVSMLKAYPHKNHQEISDEIDSAMKEVK